MNKKFIGTILAAGILFSSMPSFAAELPHAFWSLNDIYNAAVSGKNHSDIMKYGSEIVDMILKEPQTEQTSNIIGSRAYETANSAFFLGDYSTALKYFNIYVPYGKQQGWTDGVIIAENYIKQLTPVFDLYKHTGTEQVYYGAKNEPHGILTCKMMEYNADIPCTFSDAANHWGTNYINACVKAGTISGIGNNLFAPDNNITFEQAVKIITIVKGMAAPDTQYPDGFIAAGFKNKILDNLTSTDTGIPIKRIDVAVMMMQAMK